MSDHQKLKETLSALFDNEAGKVDQLELRRLVRSLEDNPDLIETYQRYTLTRAVLNRDLIYSSSNHLLADVRAALEEEEMDAVEPQPVATGVSGGNNATPQKMPWLGAIGRIAIAASVAIVAVYLVQVQPAVTVGNSAESIATNTVTERSNRILNPRVLTVSAGDDHPYPQVREDSARLPTGCVISALRADSSNLVWKKELPAGYVLCKQNAPAGSCESVSSKIGCYLD